MINLLFITLCVVSGVMCVKSFKKGYTTSYLSFGVAFVAFTSGLVHSIILQLI